MPVITRVQSTCPCCGFSGVHDRERYSDGQEVYVCPACDEMHWLNQYGQPRSWRARHELIIGIDRGTRFVKAQTR